LPWQRTDTAWLQCFVVYGSDTEHGSVQMAAPLSAYGKILPVHTLILDQQDLIARE